MNETKRVDAEERETMANWSSFGKVLTGSSISRGKKMTMGL